MMDAFDAWLEGKPAASASPQGDAFDAWLNAPKTVEAPVKPLEKLPRSALATVDDLVRQIAEGMTFGYADKFADYMNRLTGAEFGGKDLAAQRARTGEFAADNPLAAAALQIGGGIATGLPGAARMMALKGPTWLKLAGLGGAGGGIAGAGHSDADWGDLGVDALTGAATGAALAPMLGAGGNILLRPTAKKFAALSAAGGAAGGGYGAFESGGDPWETGKMAALGATLPAAAAGGAAAAVQGGKSAAQKFAERYLTGAATPGLRKLAQDLEADELTAAAARNRLMELGSEATLADLGPNLRMRAEAAANMPGPSAKQAAEFLEGRAAAEPGAVRAAARKATGATGNYFQTMDELEDAGRRAAAPLYKEAYAGNPQVVSKEIDRILETPAGRAAMESAVSRMQNRMSYVSLPDKELTDLAKDAADLGKMAAAGKVGKGLKLETLDLVKRELDDMWLSAKRAAERGTGREGDARDLNELRAAFVRALDNADETAKAGPGSLRLEGGAYARARAAYAGTAQAQDAMEAGLKALKDPPEIIAKTVKGLSEGQRQFFRMGVTRAIDDMVSNTAEGASAARAIWRKPEMRARLQAAFGNKEAFDDFAKAMEGRIKFSETRNEVLKGSQTARRLAAQQDTGVDPAALFGAAKDVASGNVVNALMGMGRSFMGALNQPSRAQMAELGPRLFEPARNERTLRELENRLMLEALGQTNRNRLLGFGALELGAQADPFPRPSSYPVIRITP